MSREASTSPDVTTETSIDSSPPDASALTTTATPARQSLSRRGHFKSRLGCYSCKRRRVKCDESRPECSPCRRLGLHCVYPVVDSATTVALSRNPSIIQLKDLRFLHQFLTAGFPTLPLQGEKVWWECAAMSHKSEALAHAILGLGASHLSQNCNVDYTAQALQHRVAAIKLVNNQFANPPARSEERDALFGAVMCLMAQSALMADSMVDYLTMSRGGNLVVHNISPDFSKSIFYGFTRAGHYELLERQALEQPKTYELADAFRASASSLEPLCTSPTQIRYQKLLVSCLDGLKVSSYEAWRQFVPLFVMPAALANEEFAVFTRPDNYISHILAIHTFLLDYLLGPYCLGQATAPKCQGRKFVIISWTRNLAERLPPEYKKHIKWPLDFCDILAEQKDSRYLLCP